MHRICSYVRICTLYTAARNIFGDTVGLGLTSNQPKFKIKKTCGIHVDVCTSTCIESFNCVLQCIAPISPIHGCFDPVRGFTHK